MRRSIVISILISLVLVLSPSTSSGQTTSSTSVEELQKQIQLLLSQIGSLQKEVTTLKSTPTTTTAPTTSVTTPTAVSTSPVTPRSFLPPELYTPVDIVDIDESEVTGTESRFIPPPNLVRSLFRGSRGEDVRQLQEFLAQDSTIYPEGIASGYYGITTEAAVRRWQAKNGVPAVGVVGRQTIAKFKGLYQNLVPTKPPLITDPKICAAYSPATCPAGEERYLVSNPLSYSSCPIYACRPVGTKKEICPALPTVDVCSAGEDRVATYKSEQCGTYYACKPRTTAPNTVAVLKKTSSIQTDTRYSLNLYDPEGVQKFSLYSAKDKQVYSGYPACRINESSPVFSVDSADFPLRLSLADCSKPSSSYFTTDISTPVVVKQVEEGLTFPYKFSSGKTVYSSEEARSYCYANGPGSGTGVAGECETKFGVVYTKTVTTTNRAVYSADSFAACMARYGFVAEAKQIKTWAQSPEPIPWSALTGAAQNATQKCESEYYGNQTVEAGPTLCADGRDNDSDGYIDSADPSCNYTTTTTGGQKEYVWNSLLLKSWIRNDADTARLDQLKAACASVKPNSNVWLPNAGLSSSADFGMPDSSKCSRAAVCTASQIFDGVACVVYTQPITTTAACSDGKDNDGDGLIDYPSDPGCYGKEDATEDAPSTSTSCSSSLKALLGTDCHYMYSGADGKAVFCDGPMTKSAQEGATTATTGCSTTTSTVITACSDGKDNDGDGLIDYPSDTGCYSKDDYDETPGTSTTTGSCDSALTTLLGTGCHQMYYDSTNNPIFCDGPMTKSAKRGDTSITAGCTMPTSVSTWPTDQASCTSKGYNWCASSSGSSGWCQSSTCSSTPTGTSGGSTTYAGDANSCPGFAYSRWDQQNRRYCQLTNETRCDYNYPSYLTNGANYTATNCPTYTSGSDTSTWCSPLGSGWSVYGSYCLNSSRTQYTSVSSPSTSSVQSCTGTDSPVTGCTPPGGGTSTTSGTTACSDGRDNDSDGLIDYPSDTGCYSREDTTEDIPSSSTTTCTSGQYWNGTACVTSTTTSTSCSAPSNCYDSAVCASSGWYWYNSGCWSSPQTTTTTTTTSTCPSGQYWSGTACVNSTTPSAAIYDQLRIDLRAMEIILRGLLGR